MAKHENIKPSLGKLSEQKTAWKQVEFKVTSKLYMQEQLGPATECTTVFDHVELHYYRKHHHSQLL